VSLLDKRAMTGVCCWRPIIYGRPDRQAFICRQPISPHDELLCERHRACKLAPASAVPKPKRQYHRSGHDVLSGPPDAKAVLMLEMMRWPNGIRCPHCGSARVGRINLKGRVGAIKCYRKGCYRTFNVRYGTPLHDSHLSNTTWTRIIEYRRRQGRDVTGYELQKNCRLAAKTTARRVARIINATPEIFNAQLREGQARAAQEERSGRCDREQAGAGRIGGQAVASASAEAAVIR
jgi:transposase-like protein